MPRHPLPGRHAWVALGALTAVVAALAAGAWGLTADRGDDHGDPAGPEWVAVPGGWLQVSDVTTRSMSHQQVPGMATMADADPVPAGFERIRIGVVLAADRVDLAWHDDDFRLTGAGFAALRPHDADLGDGLVPAASQVAGGLVFDVPEGAVDLRLQFRGSARVPIEIELSGPGHHDSPTVPAAPADGHEEEGHHH